ncbi:uncharacterized protein LOC143860780 isoform X2 [Tasmannia lanceolata]|uniref:uncharacterized protein LOC143860780 isoform X2 n=1 Tax=Tasmannia lanceolata TaxID=3420 RepID=UPI004062A6A0
MDAEVKHHKAALTVSSMLSEPKLDFIRVKYCILERFRLRLAEAGDRAPNENVDVCIYEDSLKAGFRFPIHPFVMEVLRFYGLAPSQVAPNSWRIVVGFMYVMKEVLGRDPSVEVFRRCYRPIRNRSDSWIYLSKQSDIRFIDGLPSSIHGWKGRLFYVSLDDSNPGERWEVSLVWEPIDTKSVSEKPELSGDDLATFRALEAHLQNDGPIVYSKNCDSEETLSTIGVSSVTSAMMDAAKKAEVKRVMAGKASRAQKRKESEGSSDFPIEEKEKGARLTTAGVGAGTGAKRLVSTIVSNSKDKVFRPDWSVL